MFEAGELFERGQHRLAIVDVLRQSPLAQGAAEIAGIGRQHDFTASEPQLQRLVAGGVAMGRQADDAAVAKYVMLAVEQEQFVAEVEIARG